MENSTCSWATTTLHSIRRWIRLVSCCFKASQKKENHASTKFVTSLIGVVFCFIFFHPCVATAYAQDKASVTVEPAFSELIIKETDATASSSFRIKNNTDTPLEFTLHPFDIRQTDEKGNIAFYDKPVGNQFTLATFIRVPSESLRIEPGKSTVVPIIVTNSQDMSPGGHYGAIIARFSPVKADSGQKIVPAISSILFVRKIGGEIFHLSLKKIEFGKRAVVFSIPSTVKLLFENQGNTHIIPRGVIELQDVYGKTIYEGTVNDGSTPVLPQLTREIIVPLRQISFGFPIQLYTMSVRGHGSPSAVSFAQETSFVYISPTSIIGTIVISLVLWMSLKMMRRRNKRHT